MGVSPWFFHSTSGGEDWVWRGDTLWPDRWAETLTVQPDFVEYVPTLHQLSKIYTLTEDRIVTWNDYGEAHYIGPIYADSDFADIPAGSGQFVEGFPHEAWRNFLVSPLCLLDSALAQSEEMY